MSLSTQINSYLELNERSGTPSSSLLPPPQGRLAAAFSSVGGAHRGHCIRPTRCTLPHSVPASISAPVSTSARRLASLNSSMQQGNSVLKAHVAGVCFKCFRCFTGMLQVFYIDVAKVDRDVAHVPMAIHVCFKCMF